jgi:type IV pilus assembly protein PilF
MRTTAPDYRDARRRLTWAAIGATLLLALAGCASKPGGETGASRDMVTESDETDARRRARIRMELAVGYFEQGKTNVALDELKQVIASDPTFPMRTTCAA